MNNIKNYVVYCHTSPSNKKYVGISCNPIKRWNNGKGYIKNYLFYRAIEKYGWENFKHEILYENLTIEEAGEIEKTLINKYATLAAKKFNLDLSSIIKCCKGKKKTCGGYKWQYVNT